uniref:Uncharacterized protein n=1 Tax=Romanomermis culicivorax TaxID=13658 RepID=A0A915I5P7_ROMCU
FFQDSSRQLVQRRWRHRPFVQFVGVCGRWRASSVGHLRSMFGRLRLPFHNVFAHQSGGRLVPGRATGQGQFLGHVGQSVGRFGRHDVGAKLSLPTRRRPLFKFVDQRFGRLNLRSVDFGRQNVAAQNAADARRRSTVDALWRRSQKIDDVEIISDFINFIRIRN